MDKEIVSDYIKAEKGVFTFSHSSGEQIQDAPFVYCPNYIGKVAYVVRRHERQVGVRAREESSHWA